MGEMSRAWGASLPSNARQQGQPPPDEPQHAALTAAVQPALSLSIKFQR